MKLLYAQEYIDRVLFVVEHDGQYINVYRSSGLSGTGHAGQLLPFQELTPPRPSIYGLPTNTGYIEKHMFFAGTWRYHHKDLSRYPVVQQTMDILKDFLKDVTPATTFVLDENMSIPDWDAYVNATNTALRKARENLTPYDLSKTLSLP